MNGFEQVSSGTRRVKVAVRRNWWHRRRVETLLGTYISWHSVRTYVSTEYGLFICMSICTNNLALLKFPIDASAHNAPKRCNHPLITT